MEEDQPAEEDPPTEQEDTSQAQSMNVMIALCACLTDQVAVNEDSQTSGSDAKALVMAIESASASAHITVGLVSGESLQPAVGPPVEPALAQTAAAARGKEDQISSGEAKPAPPVDRLMSVGDQMGVSTPTALAEAQLDADATTFASFRGSDEQPPAQHEPAGLSMASVSRDVASTQNVGKHIEAWHQGEHQAADITDLMVEHRASPNSMLSGNAQDHAMRQRNEQPDGHTDLPGTQSHVQGASEFGDPVSMLASDTSRSVERSLSQSGGQPVAGRAAVSSWPSGHDGYPMVQSVSLNLEPADLGPVNVRIFMMDRTVHAHIRTDHMDLGQAMLSQQPQLEARLQNSGLEMGDLKVTVDHRQLSRGDSQGWLGHQDGRPPSTVDAHQRASEEEGREALSINRQRHTGIMSFFA